jgi:hypothetical protein
MPFNDPVATAVIISRQMAPKDDGKQEGRIVRYYFTILSQYSLGENDENLGVTSLRIVCAKTKM